jgi:hypothetical protein
MMLGVPGVGQVSVGFPNSIHASFANVNGGAGNTVRAHGAAIGGGNGNEVAESAAFSVVGGGGGNQIDTNAAFAALGGGRNNVIHPYSFYSTISGGRGNVVADQDAVVGGGTSNLVDGAAGVVGGGEGNAVTHNANHSTIGGGFRNTVHMNSDYATVGGGAQNSIQQSNLCATIAGGYDNNIEANADGTTIAGGQLNRVQTEALYATIPGGLGAKASKYGQLVYASGSFSGSGDAQTSVYVCRGVSQNSAPIELFLDGAAASRRIVVPNNSTWSFEVLVAGRALVGGTSAGYHLRGVIKNHAGTTQVVGGVNQMTLGEDDAAWTAAVIADDANDALVVTVSGATGALVRWVGTVRTTEVVF